mmetsp:Transcript_38396/g.98164  ORF Transcript_38396/g.98164 Transcript_38396/m.98164 type:complete len:408 (-) Transcript_38396:1237-2460(-)
MLKGGCGRVITVSIRPATRASHPVSIIEMDSLLLPPFEALLVPLQHHKRSRGIAALVWTILHAQPLPRCLVALHVQLRHLPQRILQLIHVSGLLGFRHNFPLLRRDNLLTRKGDVRYRVHSGTADLEDVHVPEQSCLTRPHQQAVLTLEVARAGHVRLIKLDHLGPNVTATAIVSPIHSHDNHLVDVERGIQVQDSVIQEAVVHPLPWSDSVALLLRLHRHPKLLHSTRNFCRILAFQHLDQIAAVLDERQAGTGEQHVDLAGQSAVKCGGAFGKGRQGEQQLWAVASIGLRAKAGDVVLAGWQLHRLLGLGEHKDCRQAVHPAQLHTLHEYTHAARVQAGQLSDSVSELFAAENPLQSALLSVGCVITDVESAHLLLAHEVAHPSHAKALAEVLQMDVSAGRHEVC